MKKSIFILLFIVGFLNSAFAGNVCDSLSHANLKEICLKALAEQGVSGETSTQVPTPIQPPKNQDHGISQPPTPVFIQTGSKETTLVYSTVVDIADYKGTTFFL